LWRAWIAVQRNDGAPRTGETTLADIGEHGLSWLPGQLASDLWAVYDVGCPRFGADPEHLPTLTRNQVRLAGTCATVTGLAEPTNAQRDAFGFIGA
jgi:hypothetical protein